MRIGAIVRTAMLLAGLAFGGRLPAQSVSATPAPSALQARLAELGAVKSGRIGVAATLLETGESAALAGADPFPMASTAKIAIAATYLAGVDDGRFALDQMFRRGRRATISADKLIQAMLIRSDNGAADMLLRAVGGTQAVNRWLERAGVRGQRMDRTIAQLVKDDRPPVRAVKQRYRDRHHRWRTRTVWVRANPGIRPASSGDTRDNSTPSAMVALLAKLHRGVLLGEQSTAYLFDVMARCVTGSHRIRGGLPAGTPVAHKTGTLAGVSDDVGIITLPDGRHLALAIFATGMGSDAQRNRSIARAARLLYDGFVGVESAAMGWVAAR